MDKVDLKLTTLSYLFLSKISMKFRNEVLYLFYSRIFIIIKIESMSTAVDNYVKKGYRSKVSRRKLKKN